MPPADRKRFFRPELDVLRFAAFLAVFAHHATPAALSTWVRSKGYRELSQRVLDAAYAGSFGVDLFFVLSAYLITTLLMRERAEQGHVRVVSFYIRRALRIWPLYYTFLALSFFLVPHLLPGENLPLPYLAAFLLFAGNWACARSNYPPSSCALLWSVSIEEQFYLLWPVVMNAVPSNWLLLVAGGIVTVAELARVLLVEWGVGYTGIWCNTFAHLDPIGAGAAIAVLTAGSKLRFHWALRFGLALSGLAAWIFVANWGGLDRRPFLWGYPMMTLASSALLISCLGGVSDTSTSKVIGGLSYLGRISYGLYVFHLFAINLAKKITSSELSRAPLAFGITIVLAALSYRFLEQPFLRLKDRFTVIPSGSGH